MSIKHSSHARYDIWYHVAWSTKYRKKIFTDPIVRQDVEQLMREIALQYDLEIAAISVLSDHVHLSLGAPPRIAPSKAVQILKSVSTKLLFKKYSWLKQHYWGGEIWVAGYFLRTSGPGLTKEDIEQYIKEQSEEV